jgi:hypothetical protein
LERLLQAALGYDRYSERIIEAKAKISALEQAASAKPHYGGKHFYRLLTLDDYRN